MGKRDRIKQGQQSRRPCAICLRTDRPSTKEDIVPVWQLALAKSLYPNDESPPRKMIICKRCNEGSARRFESRTAPLYSRLARENPTVLPPDDQILLASWLTKSMLMQNLATAQNPGHPGIRNADLRKVSRAPLSHLIETGELPPRLRVRLGRIQRGLEFEMPHEYNALFPPIERPFIKMHAQRGLGPLYSIVLLGADDLSESFVRSLPPSPYYTDIWPPSPGTVQWPPPKTISGRQATTLEVLWSRGEKSTADYPRPRDPSPAIDRLNEVLGFDGRYGWDRNAAQG